MRPEIAAADRNFLVRRAASAWRKAGEIDAATETAIAALYADDRVRTSTIFRVLFFIFTWFGFSAAYGFGLAFLSAFGVNWDDSVIFAGVNMLTGAAMLAAVEVLTGTMKLRRFGIEEACAWIGLSYFVGGAMWGLSQGLAPGFALLCIASAWATAFVATGIAWRWATPGMGAVAASSIFVGLSQGPWNHLLWLLVGGFVIWPLGVLATASHISPEHRKRFGEAFIVFGVAFYLAVHDMVIEDRFFTFIRFLESGAYWSGGGTPEPASRLAVVASLAAMAVVPLVLLLLGARNRFRPAIVLGLLLALATAVSFAVRWEPRPLWLVLLLVGASLAALAMAARKLSSRRPGAEWRGLTALSLAEDRESLQTLELVAILAAFTPAARVVPAPGAEGNALAGGSPEGESFAGGGGDFGGGGASAKF
ncbi:MAG: hypothetical protein KBI44_19005 [Thermoanaerobaculia bacterium]|jgi:uncharacterized membrane protein YgcG|nr:hypothetical protein [Thermoanaerobaculia bacterium]